MTRWPRRRRGILGLEVGAVAVEEDVARRLRHRTEERSPVRGRRAEKVEVEEGRVTPSRRMQAREVVDSTSRPSQRAAVGLHTRHPWCEVLEQQRELQRVVSGRRIPTVRCAHVQRLDELGVEADLVPVAARDAPACGVVPDGDLRHHRRRLLVGVEGESVRRAGLAGADALDGDGPHLRVEGVRQPGRGEVVDPIGNRVHEGSTSKWHSRLWTPFTNAPATRSGSPTSNAATVRASSPKTDRSCVRARCAPRQKWGPPPPNAR